MPRTRIKFSPFKHPPDLEKIDQMKKLQEQKQQITKGQQDQELFTTRKPVLLSSPEFHKHDTFPRPGNFGTSQSPISPDAFRKAFKLRDPIQLGRRNMSNLDNNNEEEHVFSSVYHSTSPLKSPEKSANSSAIYQSSNNVKKTYTRTLDDLDSDEEEELEKSLIMSPIEILPDRLQGSSPALSKVTQGNRTASFSHSYSSGDKSLVTVSLNDNNEREPLNKGKETPKRKRKHEGEEEEEEEDETNGHQSKRQEHTPSFSPKKSSVLEIKTKRREKLSRVEDESDINLNDSLSSDEDDFEEIATQHTVYKFKNIHNKDNSQVFNGASILNIQTRSPLVSDNVLTKPLQKEPHDGSFVEQKDKAESEFDDSGEEDIGEDNDNKEEQIDGVLDPIDKTVNLSVIESTKIGASPSSSERRRRNHLGFGLTDPPVLLEIDDTDDNNSTNPRDNNNNEQLIDKSDSSFVDNGEEDDSEGDNFTNMAINGTNIFQNRRSETPTVSLPLPSHLTNTNILRAGRQTSLLNDSFLNTSDIHNGNIGTIPVFKRSNNNNLLNFSKLGSSPVRAAWNRSISDVINKQLEQRDSDSTSDDSSSSSNPSSKSSSNDNENENDKVDNEDQSSDETDKLPRSTEIDNSVQEETELPMNKSDKLEWSPEKWTKLKNDIELFLFTKDIRVFNKDRIRQKYDCDLNEIYQRCNILKKLYFNSSD